MILDQLLQSLLGLVGLVERVEIDRELDLGVAPQRRILRHALVDLDRKLRVLHLLVEIGERQQRQRLIGREIERELQIDEPEILAAAAAERGAEPVQHFGGAGLRHPRPAAAVACPSSRLAIASTISGWRGNWASKALNTLIASSFLPLRDSQEP